MKPTAFIAGSAQLSRRPDVGSPWRRDEPATLVTESARRALADTGIKTIASRVDAIACAESFAWSYVDLCSRVAQGIGCTQELRQFWVPSGGNSPQDLLHDMCSAVAAGEIHCAVLAGAEALYSRNRAYRESEHLDWSERPAATDPFRGQKPFSSALEQRHGLGLPTQAFPLFENAIRAANGRSANEQSARAARLLAKNARVAADNPYAWFRDAPSAHDIATVTPENRLICYPYTKRMNAIMNVDQSAAIVIISEKLMQELGIESRCAAVLGGAGAQDAWFVSERESLDASPAMQVAMAAALNHAGLDAAKIDAFDFYSCFPSAIEFALSALNIEDDDDRPFSLTGGLAFAGGPGNAYVLHSLAAAASRLREGNARTALVTGLGMACAKHAATVLARTDTIPPDASGQTPKRVEHTAIACDTVDVAEGDGKVVSYTIDYRRDGSPQQALYVLDLVDGRRTMANSAVPVEQAATELLAIEPVGRTGTITHDTEHGTNRFAFH
jgi:acetyl-CoA C-acetyltransferase